MARYKKMEDHEILVIDKRVKVTEPGTTRIFILPREKIIEKYKGEYNEFCISNLDRDYRYIQICQGNGKRLDVEYRVQFIFMDNEFVEISRCYKVVDEKGNEDFRHTDAKEVADWVNNFLGVNTYSAENFNINAIKDHFQKVRDDERFCEKAKRFLRDFKSLLKDYNFSLEGEAYADYEAAAAKILVHSEDLHRSAPFINVSYNDSTDVVDESDIVLN